MNQSRLMSATETTTNMVAGLAISWLFTFYGLPLIFGIEPTALQAIEISASYFVLSGVRLYILRRAFNGLAGL